MPVCPLCVGTVLTPTSLRCACRSSRQGRVFPQSVATVVGPTMTTLTAAPQNLNPVGILRLPFLLTEAFPD